MRIGLDVDGVLANFIPAYQALVVKHAGGLDMFLPGDDVDPPTWDWPELRGYTKDIMKAVWQDIKLDPSFWLLLDKLPGVRDLRQHIDRLERNHDVYFITSRVGMNVKRQTEAWLHANLWYEDDQFPTVLITGHRVKGSIAKALHLDAYIDDNWENAQDCAAESPLTRTYLLNRAYNQPAVNADADDALVIRVDGVKEMLEEVAKQ